MAVHDMLIRIGAEVSPGFQAGIKKAFSGIESLMGGAAGGALVGAPSALAGLAQSRLKDMANIQDLSKLTGMTPEYLGKLQRAADVAGVSMESMGAKIFKMQTVAGNAPEKFFDLGLDPFKANGDLKSGAQLFEDVMQKLAGIRNETERNTAAQKFFGRNSIDVIKVLDNYNEGMRHNVVVTKEAAKAAEDFDENLNRIWSNLKERAEITLGPVLKIAAALGAKATAIDGKGSIIPGMSTGLSAIPGYSVASAAFNWAWGGSSDPVLGETIQLAKKQKDATKAQNDLMSRVMDFSGGW